MGRYFLYHPPKTNTVFFTIFSEFSKVRSDEQWDIDSTSPLHSKTKSNHEKVFFHEKGT
jgi:hypothetical protein